jgi:hypothetical protein
MCVVPERRRRTSVQGRSQPGSSGRVSNPIFRRTIKALLNVDNEKRLFHKPI